MDAKQLPSPRELLWEVFRGGSHIMTNDAPTRQCKVRQDSTHWLKSIYPGPAANHLARSPGEGGADSPASSRWSAYTSSGVRRSGRHAGCAAIAYARPKPVHASKSSRSALIRRRYLSTAVAASPLTSAPSASVTPGTSESRTSCHSHSRERKRVSLACTHSGPEPLPVDAADAAGGGSALFRQAAAAATIPVPSAMRYRMREPARWAATGPPAGRATSAPTRSATPGPRHPV